MFAFLSLQIFIIKKLVFSVLVVKEGICSRGWAPSGVFVDTAQEGIAQCRAWPLGSQE